MRILLTISLLLLGVSWAAAQETPESSGQKYFNQEVTGVSGVNRSIQGCVSKSGENYTLKSETGKTYVLAGDASKLADHVGHEVIITGTRKSAGNTAGPSGESVGTMATQENEPILNVMDVRHISQTCKSAREMSH